MWYGEGMSPLGLLEARGVGWGRLRRDGRRVRLVLGLFVLGSLKGWEGDHGERNPKTKKVVSSEQTRLRCQGAADGDRGKQSVAK